MVKQALLSVSDKTGIVDFAQKLHGFGVRILSTSGTGKLLKQAGLPVVDIASYTGFPEMLDGRVKTLHPRIHAGLLGRRDLSSDMEQLIKHGISPIDLIVINLYPFEKIIMNENCRIEEAIEAIDIGGMSMLRSAAKNYKYVTVLVDSKDYECVLDELCVNGIVSASTNLKLASKAFAHTARYEILISNYMLRLNKEVNTESNCFYPSILNMSFRKVQDLRYGENPHQSAALYRNLSELPTSFSLYRKIQGKELSYNNMVDADTAWKCIKSFGSFEKKNPFAVAIIKHANPCGVANGATVLEAYKKALQTDPVSAFGGIVAFNCELDEKVALEVIKQFSEVLIAPKFSNLALDVFKTKPNIRVLEMPINSKFHDFDLKQINSGLLMQSVDDTDSVPYEWQVVTKRKPTSKEMEDSLFAWRVAKFVKSNAIVFCSNGMTLGIGAGQTSRLDSARFAVIKAAQSKLPLVNSVVASDAFFPFPDALEVVIDAGATCIIQPGGSVNDAEIIKVANKYSLAMILTNIRHFRH